MNSSVNLSQYSQKTVQGGESASPYLLCLKFIGFHLFEHAVFSQYPSQYLPAQS